MFFLTFPIPCFISLFLIFSLTLSVKIATHVFHPQSPGISYALTARKDCAEDGLQVHLNPICPYTEPTRKACLNCSFRVSLTGVFKWYSPCVMLCLLRFLAIFTLSIGFCISISQRKASHRTRSLS